MSTPWPRLSRRSLLGLGAGAVLAPALGGCARTPAPAGAPSSDACPAFGRASTVAELLRQPRFLLAHRGSGDNWPEHTLLAYRESLAAGAAAVEISVRRTQDGVLVCHHDADTARTTGENLVLARTPWSRVRDLRVDARRWLGPASEPQPISRLEDVLAALPQDCLAFVEDKDGTSADALLNLLDAQPRAKERFIWKQWAGAGQIRLATDRGYLSWGYLGPELLDRLAELAPRFTSLGIGTEQPDAVVSRVVAIGKPVIAWEVHRRSDAERLYRLGVAGLMCSNVRYVLNCEAAATSDDFSAGLRSPGDLPSVEMLTWDKQPRFDTARGVLALNPAVTQAYQLGSLCPVGENYTISTSFRWSGRAGEAGLGFCREDDSPYNPYPSARSAQPGGFRLRLGPTGRVELAEQAPGSAINGLLGSLDLPAPGQGGAVPIEISVSPGRIRLAGHGQEATANNVAPRGRYLFLWARGAPVEVGSIAIRPGS